MAPRLRVILVLTCVGLLSACAELRFPSDSSSAPGHAVFTQVGIASWYGKTHHGRTTANGEAFDMNALTAAHRSLPFGTVVRVTNLATNRMVKVRINDRGPYVAGRIIDLSARAARELGLANDGVAQVRIQEFAADQPAGT